jgi:hypothetical protein
MLGQLGFLAVAHLLGGPPWVVLGVLGFLGQIVADFRSGPLLRLAPALLWAAAAAAMGNRELFFPYAIFLATHVLGELWPRGAVPAALGGAGIVAAFLVIRLLQAATLRVLGVELAVAALIMAAACFVVSRARDRSILRWLVPPAASLLACAGLAL